MLRKKILNMIGIDMEPKEKTIAISGNNLLGEILIIENKCTRKQVHEALKLQKTKGAGRSIGSLLMVTCNLSQDDITEALEIQTYLREKRCANKSMERLESAANNFLLQKQIFRESIQDMKVTLDKVDRTT